MGKVNNYASVIADAKVARKNVAKSDYSKKIDEIYASYEKVTKSTTKSLCEYVNNAKVDACKDFAIKELPQEYGDFIKEQFAEVANLERCSKCTDSTSRDYVITLILSANLAELATKIDAITNGETKKGARLVSAIEKAVLSDMKLNLWLQDAFAPQNKEKTARTLLAKYESTGVTLEMCKDVVSIVFYRIKNKESK